MPDQTTAVPLPEPDEPRFVLRVLWGTFGPGGRWWPNPLLPMSEAEQQRQNVENGYAARASQPGQEG